MNKFIYELLIDNKPLPKGTRIKSTIGGMKTGSAHELSDYLMSVANKVPNCRSDYVPYWILAWEDLHNELLEPNSHAQ